MSCCLSHEHWGTLTPWLLAGLFTSSPRRHSAATLEILGCHKCRECCGIYWPGSVLNIPQHSLYSQNKDYAGPNINPERSLQLLSPPGLPRKESCMLGTSHSPGKPTERWQVLVCGVISCSGLDFHALGKTTEIINSKKLGCLLNVSNCLSWVFPGYQRGGRGRKINSRSGAESDSDKSVPRKYEKWGLPS